MPVDREFEIYIYFVPLSVFRCLWLPLVWLWGPFSTLRGVLGLPLAIFGLRFGPPWGTFGIPFVVLGHPWDPLGASLTTLESIWLTLGSILLPLGCLWDAFRPLWVALGYLLAASGFCLLKWTLFSVQKCLKYRACAQNEASWNSPAVPAATCSYPRSSAELVSGTVPQTSPPHTPGGRMTWVKQISSNGHV